MSLINKAREVVKLLWAVAFFAIVFAFSGLKADAAQARTTNDYRNRSVLGATSYRHSANTWDTNWRYNRDNRVLGANAYRYGDRRDYYRDTRVLGATTHPYRYDRHNRVLGATTYRQPYYYPRVLGAVDYRNRFHDNRYNRHDYYKYNRVLGATSYRYPYYHRPKVLGAVYYPYARPTTAVLGATYYPSYYYPTVYTQPRVLGATYYPYSNYNYSYAANYVSAPRVLGATYYPSTYPSAYTQPRVLGASYVPSYSSQSYHSQSYNPAPVYNSNEVLGAVNVSISNFEYNPRTLNIAAGTTVIWTNDDSAPHTVTSNSGVFDSGVLAPGQTYSMTFSSAGTYTYYCKLHPEMVGTVVVGASASDYDYDGSVLGETTYSRPTTLSTPAVYINQAYNPVINVGVRSY